MKKTRDAHDSAMRFTRGKAFRRVTFSLVIAAVLLLQTLLLFLPVSAADETGAYNAIVAGLEANKTDIDIGRYSLTLEQTSNVVGRIYDRCPQFFYVDFATGGWSIYCNVSTGLAVKVVFSFNMTGSVLTAAKREYETLVASLIEACNVSGCTDFECVLGVHDTMISLYSYANSNANMHYDAYRIMKTGYGVCQAYTMLFLAVMQKMGIECIVVNNIPTAEYPNNRHCWNMVRLEDRWYHIDVTWDDPVTNDGRKWIQHKYFLISDSALIARDDDRGTHLAWTPDIHATDTKYENSALSGVNSPFIRIGGDYYSYTENASGTGSVCRYNMSTLAATPIYTIPDVWECIGLAGYNWSGSFSGFGAYGGRLYFNTPDAVKSLLPAGTGLQTVLEHSSTETDIYGMFISGSKLTYYTGTSPNDPMTANVVSLPDTASAPVTTKTPDTTSNPATTKTPDTTSNPATTETPDTTSNPVTTEVPDTTSDPVTTKTPDTTSNPVTTEAPDTTSVSLTTEESITTTTPVTTAAGSRETTEDESDMTPTNAQAPHSTVSPVPTVSETGSVQTSGTSDLTGVSGCGCSLSTQTAIVIMSVFTAALVALALVRKRKNN